MNTKLEGIYNVLNAVAQDMQQYKTQATSSNSISPNQQGVLASNPQARSSLPAINPPLLPQFPRITSSLHPHNTSSNNQIQSSQETALWNKNSPFPNLKLDFPVFNGDEMVQEWLNQVELFFRFHQTEEHLWVAISSFYLKKDALKWWGWYTKNIPEFNSWPVFKEEILTRFNDEDGGSL